MEQAIKIKVPGKLMVAGEFAVLEKHHPLIVMAVNRFVETTIEKTPISRVCLPDVEVPSATWDFLKKRVHIHHSSRRMSFVNDAMSYTLRYLKEQNIEIEPFTITVHSELDDKKTGVKFGLGSSAAVVTSVVRAILQLFLGDKVTDELVFKLASISHVKTQGNGSGADIAASTYGGVLLYTSFQAEWLLSQFRKTRSITELIEKDWKYLSIKQLKFPPSIQLAVGWTGKAASTKSLVKEVKKMDDRSVYEAFLVKSKTAVLLMIEGMETGNVAKFLKGIEQNRIALAEMGNIAKVPIETEKLRKLRDEAVKLGGAGKLSGAGGGDCGIAFLPLDKDVDELYKAWEQLNIKPLTINVYERAE